MKARSSRTARAMAVVALAAGIMVALGSSAQGKGGGQVPEVGAQALTEATINSSGPLTQIVISNELNCQVEHSGDSAFEFFSDIPGACGTLIATGGTLYGPSDIPAGESASPRTTYTQVSQTPVTGTGTSGDPFTVVTVVDAGSSGLRLTETDSYVVGTESYRTDVMVSNTSDTSHSFVLYRAGDCFLQNSDEGFGDLNTSTGVVGCRGSDDGGATPNSRVIQWVPLVSGSSAIEDGFDEVWAAIGTQNPFPNTCQCTSFIDNGGGISWSGSVGAGASVTYSQLTIFSPQGVTTPFITKTAANDQVGAGAQDSYTITVTNPLGITVHLNTVTDHLPAGFSYIAGSTSGGITTDPTANGQDITWTGPFTMAANSTLTFSFNVRVSTVGGIYSNSVDGTTTESAVAGTGPTAPIQVVVVVTPSFTG
jgi:uncharacterized repeat protein (TIGR01451 family)